MDTDTVPVRSSPSAPTPVTASLKVSDLYSRLGAGKRESQAVMLSTPSTRKLCAVRSWSRVPSIRASRSASATPVRSLLTLAVRIAALRLS